MSFTEWGQIAILNCLAEYTPNDQEAGDIIERILPRLQHANCSVVLSAMRVLMIYLSISTKAELEKVALKKMVPPLSVFFLIA